MSATVINNDELNKWLCTLGPSILPVDHRQQIQAFVNRKKMNGHIFSKFIHSTDHLLALIPTMGLSSMHKVRKCWKHELPRLIEVCGGDNTDVQHEYFRPHPTPQEPAGATPSYPSSPSSPPRNVPERKLPPGAEPLWHEAPQRSLNRNGNGMAKSMSALPKSGRSQMMEQTQYASDDYIQRSSYPHHNKSNRPPPITSPNHNPQNSGYRDSGIHVQWSDDLYTSSMPDDPYLPDHEIDDDGLDDEYTRSRQEYYPKSHQKGTKGFVQRSPSSAPLSQKGSQYPMQSYKGSPMPSSYHYGNVPQMGKGRGKEKKENDLCAGPPNTAAGCRNTDDDRPTCGSAPDYCFGPDNEYTNPQLYSGRSHDDYAYMPPSRNGPSDRWKSAPRQQTNHMRQSGPHNSNPNYQQLRYNPMEQEENLQDRYNRHMQQRNQQAWEQEESLQDRYHRRMQQRNQPNRDDEHFQNPSPVQRGCDARNPDALRQPYEKNHQVVDKWVGGGTTQTTSGKDADRWNVAEWLGCPLENPKETPMECVAWIRGLPSKKVPETDKKELAGLVLRNNLTFLPLINYLKENQVCTHHVQGSVLKFLEQRRRELLLSRAAQATAQENAKFKKMGEANARDPENQLLMPLRGSSAKTGKYRNPMTIGTSRSETTSYSKGYSDYT